MMGNFLKLLFKDTGEMCTVCCGVAAPWIGLPIGA